jgi:hypothetical protein
MPQADDACSSDPYGEAAKVEPQDQQQEPTADGFEQQQQEWHD